MGALLGGPDEREGASMGEDTLIDVYSTEHAHGN